MARRRLNPDAPPMTGAERQKRYREKLRKAGLVERWIAKDVAKSVPEEIERQIFGDDPDREVRLPGEFRHGDEMEGADDALEAAPSRHTKH